MSKPRDIVIERFAKEGLEYNDKRPNGGALWVIGGKELEPIISEVSSMLRISFTFCSNGGKTSNYRPAWFTKAKKYLLATVESQTADSSIQSETKTADKEEAPLTSRDSVVTQAKQASSPLQAAQSSSDRSKAAVTITTAESHDYLANDAWDDSKSTDPFEARPKLHKRFGSLSLSEAKSWCDQIDKLSDDEFESLINKWKRHDVSDIPSQYLTLREYIVWAFVQAKGDILNTRKMYPVDVEVGLVLYRELNKMGFTIVDAGNDNIWRYLTINVFPDITYIRYPKPDKGAEQEEGRINRKRFFSHTRRIWLKTLWWYIHLSWQGDVEHTREAIKENGSDIISHFIERPGRGYRYDLSRSFMLEYSRQSNKSDELFRRAAKLNLAECRVIEPALTTNGVEGYCKELFERFSDRKTVS